MSYDINTDIGKVRLLCIDTDEAIFSDDEIQAFINLTSVDGSVEVRLAAALALDTIASSQTLILKKISTLDLSTDGPALAASLRDSAVRLRKDVEEDIAFGYAEIGHNVWTTYEIIINEELRNNTS